MAQAVVMRAADLAAMRRLWPWLDATTVVRAPMVFTILRLPHTAPSGQLGPRLVPA